MREEETWIHIHIHPSTTHSSTPPWSRSCVSTTRRANPFGRPVTIMPRASSTVDFKAIYKLLHTSFAFLVGFVLLSAIHRRYWSGLSYLPPHPTTPHNPPLTIPGKTPTIPTNAVSCLMKVGGSMNRPHFPTAVHTKNGNPQVVY